MKLSAIKKLTVFILISMFTQFSMAADNASAVSEIAGIVAGMNHFPSDADKTKLMAIAEDGMLAQGVRDMATTVANIQHFPNDEGKAAMARIMENEQAPEMAKTLASIIANFAHMVGADDKAKLEAMMM